MRLHYSLFCTFNDGNTALFCIHIKLYIIYSSVSVHSKNREINPIYTCKWIRIREFLFSFFYIFGFGSSSGWEHWFSFDLCVHLFLLLFFLNTIPFESIVSLYRFAFMSYSIHISLDFFILFGFDFAAVLFPFFRIFCVQYDFHALDSLYCWILDVSKANKIPVYLHSLESASYSFL